MLANLFILPLEKGIVFVIFKYNQISPERAHRHFHLYYPEGPQGRGGLPVYYHGI